MVSNLVIIFNSFQPELFVLMQNFLSVIYRLQISIIENVICKNLPSKELNIKNYGFKKSVGGEGAFF